MRLRFAAVLAAALLAGCAAQRQLPGDDEPTLASLGRRSVTVARDDGIAAAEERTIAAYRSFLDAAPHAPQRAEALRRLGDLEMDRADRGAADGGDGARDYRAAVARYVAFLSTYPDDPHDDRVLYQLARAQEQGGDIDAALQTLTRLVQRHPRSAYADEANFRRGELLFAMRDYARAETAYASVLANSAAGALHDRALYMQGWALFKQGRLDAALAPFFAVLDIELGALGPRSRDEGDLAALPELARADRELVEDTFRVLSIALENLQGAASIAPNVTTPLRQGYRFRVYQQLAELYVRQDRIKDAADTYAGFVERDPLHAQAPLMQARIIALYERAGFETLALQAKREHVARYGADSDFRRANPGGWAQAQPLVKVHLADLARHYHALAQKGHAAADAQQAEHWYRAWLAAFPDATDAPHTRFLLAELLTDTGQSAQAAAEYESVAYTGPGGARSADAGFAALLAYATLEHAAQDDAQRRAWQRRGVDSALRFAAAYAADARCAAVLAHAAEQLAALGDGGRATSVARQALALPAPGAEPRRSAWGVIAREAFERKDYAAAEAAWREALALAPTADRDATVERLAAAIYEQGAMAREGGRARDAVGHFERVAALDALAAHSPLRASAQLDAAAALIAIEDWAAAARTLEDFRRGQPGHALQAEVAPKLALVYLKLGRAAPAAAEFERVAAQSADAAVARSALWQAAELYDKAADGAAARSPQLAAAIAGYERYLRRYPQPLEPAVQARARLAALAQQDGLPARALAWTREVRESDRAGGDARTPRTRALGGAAALALAEPLVDAYRQVPLVEPLARQLKLKKARMQAALRAYADAAEVGIAEVTTDATCRSAALYQDFGKALLASARPHHLDRTEREQYDLMLEEQAFPFEEQAIALHEANLRRIVEGIYDENVRRSLAALAQLVPGRYARPERGDPALPADVAAIEAALQTQPRQPALLNQLGIAQRRAGRFDAAREAYEAAIAADAGAAAPRLNLAILYDLYLSDAARALPLYERALELSPSDAPMLGKWLAELKSRKAPAATLAARRETP